VLDLEVLPPRLVAALLHLQFAGRARDLARRIERGESAGDARGEAEAVELHVAEHHADARVHAPRVGGLDRRGVVDEELVRADVVHAGEIGGGEPRVRHAHLAFDVDRVAGDADREPRRYAHVGLGDPRGLEVVAAYGRFAAQPSVVPPPIRTVHAAGPRWPRWCWPWFMPVSPAAGFPRTAFCTTGESMMSAFES
jgi:hypothetical protein